VFCFKYVDINYNTTIVIKTIVKYEVAIMLFSFLGNISPNKTWGRGGRDRARFSLTFIHNW